MIKASNVLASTKNRIDCLHDGNIPRLHDVRRVPPRYQQVLPLPVSKCYHCVVLGRASHTLTVGIIEHKDEELLDFLHRLTGAAIFPVLVEPKRMNLLVARMERYQRFRRRHSQAYYVLQLPLYVRQILLFRERKKRGA